MDFKHYIINEAAYEGNMGFEEMVKFYQMATDTEIDKMENIIKNNDWIGFKRLIRKITGVTLK